MKVSTNHFCFFVTMSFSFCPQDNHQECHRTSPVAFSLRLLPVHLLGRLRPYRRSANRHLIRIIRQRRLLIRPIGACRVSLRSHPRVLHHGQRGVHGILCRGSSLHRSLRTPVGRNRVSSQMGGETATGKISGRQVCSSLFNIIFKKREHFTLWNVWPLVVCNTSYTKFPKPSR